MPPTNRLSGRQIHRSIIAGCEVEEMTDRQAFRETLTKRDGCNAHVDRATSPDAPRVL